MKKHLDLKYSNRLQVKQFIIDVLRCFIKREREKFLITDTLDWTGVSNTVSRLKLGPIFKNVFSGQNVPEPVLTQWNEEQILTFVKNIHALVFTIRIFKILDQIAIPSVVLRGISLINHIYPKDSISLRPMVDVDMLINPCDKDNLRKALQSKGIHIVKQLRSQMVYVIDGIKFEIHWSLLTPKRYRSAVNSETFLETRQCIDLPEGRIYCLTKENELLGLVIHAFIHHELKGILPLVDMAILIVNNQLDWQYIAEWCKKAKMSKMFFFTLSLVNRLFDLNLEDKLSLFGQSFFIKRNTIFDAYINRFFKEDCFSDYLRRKRNLFCVAEHPITKFRQAFRLFAYDELCEFVKVLC